jgi:hypothetical protein
MIFSIVLICLFNLSRSQNIIIYDTVVFNYQMFSFNNDPTQNFFIILTPDQSFFIQNSDFVNEFKKYQEVKIKIKGDTLIKEYKKYQLSQEIIDTVQILNNSISLYKENEFDDIVMLYYRSLILNLLDCPSFSKYNDVNVIRFVSPIVYVKNNKEKYLYGACKVNFSNTSVLLDIKIGQFEENLKFNLIIDTIYSSSKIESRKMRNAFNKIEFNSPKESIFNPNNWNLNEYCYDLDSKCILVNDSILYNGNKKKRIVKLNTLVFEFLTNILLKNETR